MEVDLIAIFESHIKKGLSYCCICLRSEKETRLVEPKHLSLFTAHVNLHRSFYNLDMKKICYMCEAHAKNALRMYQACVNAIAACTLVKQLQRVSNLNLLPPPTEQSVRVCNTRLKNIRANTRLRNTEVLVIDSFGMRVTETFGTGSKETPPTAKPYSSEFETVVLDDDDDDSDILSVPVKTSKQTPAKIQNITPSPPFIATDEKNRVRPNQIMFIQNDENQTIPVLIVDNGNIGQNGNHALLNPIQKQIPIPNGQPNPTTLPVAPNMHLVQTSQTNTFIVQPEELAELLNQNDNTMQLAPKSNDNDEIDKILSRKLDSLQSEARKAKSSYVVDIDTVNKMIFDKGYNGNSCNKTCSPNQTVEEEAPLAVISKVVSEATGAFPKDNAMVDFEDKIPMDVISFMDATDPTAPAESIMPPPLANQSGVRTRPPAKRKLEQVVFTID